MMKYVFTLFVVITFCDPNLVFGTSNEILSISGLPHEIVKNKSGEIILVTPNQALHLNKSDGIEWLADSMLHFDTNNKFFQVG